MVLTGETEVLGEKCLRVTFSTTNPTWTDLSLKATLSLAAVEEPPEPSRDLGPEVNLTNTCRERSSPYRAINTVRLNFNKQLFKCCAEKT